MSLANRQVFDQYVLPVVQVLLNKNINLFNGASGGAITLAQQGFAGNFSQQAFINSLSTSGRRVDRFSANNPVTATPLTESVRNSVKVAGGFGPIVYEPSEQTWLNRPTQENIQAISQQFADLLLEDMVDASIASLVAAIGNQATLINDVSATTGISYAAMNGAHAKFGDASSRLITSIVNGATAHKLIDANLANSNQLFSSDTVNIYNILGKRMVVIDSASLFVDDTVDKVRILTLTSGAAEISGAGDVITNVETKNGNERIETTFQADYSFGISLKGFSWDIANGGKSPTNAEIQTGANWDLIAPNVKQAAGVMTVAQA